MPLSSPGAEVARLVGLQTQKGVNRAWEFSINTACDEYRDLISGHVVGGSLLCPRLRPVRCRCCHVKTGVGNNRVRFDFSHLSIERIFVTTNLDLVFGLRSTKTSVGGFPVSAAAFDFRVVSCQNPTASPVSHASCTAILHADNGGNDAAVTGPLRTAHGNRSD